jgi:hypothetical protein
VEFAARGSHVKAGYYAFDDTNVDPSMRRAINDSDVSKDLNARKAGNAVATQERESDL